MMVAVPVVLQTLSDLYASQSVPVDVWIGNKGQVELEDLNP